MRILIDNGNTPAAPRPYIGHYGRLRKAYLEQYRPDLYLSQMRSCMSIAPRLTKPPGAGLTLSCRSLQRAQELPKHSKLPTP